MDAEIRFLEPGEMPPIDQVWECPVCQTQMGMLSPAVMGPAKCAMGHPATEMEQRTVKAWRTNA